MPSNVIILALSLIFVAIGICRNRYLSQSVFVAIGICRNRPTMRADRLLSIVLLLQGHGRLTGRELSERLEVSERTLHRDMEALSAAGVPVFALRGSRGGWQLDEGWRTQVPGLDEVELRALLMAQTRVIGDAWLSAAAER